MPATLKLIECFGGSRVYVPRLEQITEDHAIARAIGMAAARAVSRIWVNEQWEVPRATRAKRLARDRAIRREPRTISVAKLALKYGLTERQVYKIRELAARASKRRCA